MKAIKISVACRYYVEIACDVSDEVYEQLCEIQDNGGTILSDEIRDLETTDWLAENVNERDSLSREYEILDFND